MKEARPPVAQSLSETGLLDYLSPMSAGSEFVDATLAQQKKVTIFGKSECPYCQKAIDAIDLLVDEQIIEPDDVIVEIIDDRDDYEQIMDYLLQLTGERTVPRVFIKGKFYGGGDDTEAGVESGELTIMLQ